MIGNLINFVMYVLAVVVGLFFFYIMVRVGSLAFFKSFQTVFKLEGGNDGKKRQEG